MEVGSQEKTNTYGPPGPGSAAATVTHTELVTAVSRGCQEGRRRVWGRVGTVSVLPDEKALETCLMEVSIYRTLLNWTPPGWVQMVNFMRNDRGDPEGHSGNCARQGLDGECLTLSKNTPAQEQHSEAGPGRKPPDAPRDCLSRPVTTSWRCRGWDAAPLPTVMNFHPGSALFNEMCTLCLDTLLQNTPFRFY